VKEAAAKKEPNGQFNIALASAMLARDSQTELAQLKELAAFLDQPHSGMLESDRGIARATVLRERVRVAAFQGLSSEASKNLTQLEQLATDSRDLFVEACYESARGYVLASQNDLQNAAYGLAADTHSPMALQQLAHLQEKLGNSAAAQATRTRLRYQRAPTVEWFLVTHLAASKTPSKDNDKEGPTAN